MSNLNDKPCGGCVHFTPVQANANHGRCATKSVYPNKEQPGQSFPDNVKRAAPGELAKPYIVTRMQVVGNCSKYRSK